MEDMLEGLRQLFWIGLGAVILVPILIGIIIFLLVT